METINENTVVPYDKTVVVLGNFDGLHMAHRTIIQSGIKYATEKGLKCGVLLFNENTKTITEKNGVKLITDSSERMKLLSDMGLDFAYTVNFDGEFMKKTPEEFVSWLVKYLNPTAAFAGYDYRFGYKAEGDAEALKRLGGVYGFNAVITPEIRFGGDTVSSTLIRSLIESGDVKKANCLLGRNFGLSGVVEYGLQNGRKMGFPTANLAYDKHMVIPHTGVYAGYTVLDGESFESVINVGNNPTFNAKKVTVESNIFDFDRYIYGQNIRIEFVEKIRGDIKFGGVEELKKQISADAENAKVILRGGI